MAADTTLLGQGTLWKGEILAGQKSLCIEGTLEGSITSDGKVTIAPTGRVKGTILARHLVVTGHGEGTFKVSECLELHGSGSVEGEVEWGSLVVDEGSSLQGKCTRRGFSRSPGPSKGEEASPSLGQVRNRVPAGAQPGGTRGTGRPLRLVLGILGALVLLAVGGLAYRRLRRPSGSLERFTPQPPGTVLVQPPAQETRVEKGEGLKAHLPQSQPKGTAAPIPSKPAGVAPLPEAGQEKGVILPKKEASEEPGKPAAPAPVRPNPEDKKETPGP